MKDPFSSEQIDLLKYAHSTAGTLFTTEDVPDWMAEWCAWAKELLLEDWSVYVAINDNPSPKEPDVAAKTEYRHEYLLAEMVFRRDIRDNIDGWIAILHEFVHAFLSHMSASAYNITRFGNASLKRLNGEKDFSDEDFDPLAVIVHDSFNDAEETVVVKLSRALVGLRQRQMALEHALREDDGTSEATTSMGNA
jgi:hypothetical protein